MELLPVIFLLILANFLIIKLLLKKLGAFWIFIIILFMYSLVLKYGIEKDDENVLYN